MGFDAEIQFKSSPRISAQVELSSGGFSKNVTFQAGRSGGANILFVEQLPSVGVSENIYALAHAHQVSPNGACVSFHIYRNGQWYTVSDERVKMLNDSVFVAESQAERAYKSSLSELEVALNLLYQLQEDEESTAAEIAQAQEEVAELQEEVDSLYTAYLQAKAAADAARQEVEAENNGTGE